MGTTAQLANLKNVQMASFGTAANTRTITGTTGSPPTNIVKCYTAGTSGGLVYRMTFQAAFTTTASVIVLYRYDGTNYMPIAELLCAVTTASTTAVCYHRVIDFTNTLQSATTATAETTGIPQNIAGLLLGANDQLWVGHTVIQAGGAMAVLVEGADF